MTQASGIIGVLPASRKAALSSRATHGPAPRTKSENGKNRALAQETRISASPLCKTEHILVALSWIPGKRLLAEAGGAPGAPLGHPPEAAFARKLHRREVHHIQRSRGSGRL